MKQLLLPIMFLLAIGAKAQNIVSSVNSGAVNNSSLAYTVGEIFVQPAANPNQANSGLLGVLSRIEFLVLGVGQTLSSDDINAYPNPATHSLYFNTGLNTAVQQVFIYDINGRLADTKPVASNQVDLTNLKAGIYLVKTDLNKLQSFKIIKQ